MDAPGRHAIVLVRLQSKFRREAVETRFSMEEEVLQRLGQRPPGHHGLVEQVGGPQAEGVEKSEGVATTERQPARYAANGEV